MLTVHLTFQPVVFLHNYLKLVISQIFYQMEKVTGLQMSGEWVRISASSSFPKAVYTLIHPQRPVTCSQTPKLLVISRHSCVCRTVFPLAAHFMAAGNLLRRGASGLMQMLCYQYRMLKHQLGAYVSVGTCCQQMDACCSAQCAAMEPRPGPLPGAPEMQIGACDVLFSLNLFLLLPEPRIQIC